MNAPPRIHPTAIVSSKAELGARRRDRRRSRSSARAATIGDGCVIAPRATLERNVTLGTRT